MAAHCFPLQNYEVWAYEGDGVFSLYEDSEEKTCVTIFKMTHTRGKQVLEIFTKGDPSFLPINRVITLLTCKERLYRRLCLCDSSKAFEEIVKSSEISSITKLRLMETLNKKC